MLRTEYQDGIAIQFGSIESMFDTVIELRRLLITISVFFGLVFTVIATIVSMLV